MLLAPERGPRLVVADRDNLATLDDGGSVLVLHVAVNHKRGRGQLRSTWEGAVSSHLA